MPYTIRNTLMLLILAISVLSAGTYTVSHQLENEVVQVEGILTDKEAELVALRTDNASFEIVIAGYQTAQETWLNYDKQLPEMENSVITFAILNDLTSQSHSRLNFYFRLISPRKSMADNIKINSYSLSGETYFRNLYNFIWKLEHYAPLYMLDELEIIPQTSAHGNSRDQLNTVSYSLIIRGYSAEDLLPERQEPRLSVQPDSISYNPFYKLVQKTVLPNINNELEIGSSELLGLTHSAAYIRNRQGKIWEMSKGDNVYLGYLSEIDPVTNSVEFILDEGGYRKYYTLKINGRSNSQ